MADVVADPSARWNPGPAPVTGWGAVPGQRDAVARLQAALECPVHAYLFVGPGGSGRRAALRVFAGERFAAGVADPVAAERHRRLAAAEHHPDLVVVEPEGAVFRGGRGAADTETEASVLIREAYASPVEAACKIVAAIGFETANDAAVGALLKTIEEPPERTTIVLVSEVVPTSQAAIASRCVRVDFGAIEPATLREILVAEGIDGDRAEIAAASAAGSIERARVLATDERLALRIAAWEAVPRRLDGTGATATLLVGELRATLDDALAPVAAHHAAELASFDAEVETYGITGATGRRHALQARHKRVERQSRLSELRLGLGAMARVYRDRATTDADPRGALEAIDVIGRAAGTFALSPNEELTLTALFWGLPGLGDPTG